MEKRDHGNFGNLIDSTPHLNLCCSVTAWEEAKWNCNFSMISGCEPSFTFSRNKSSTRALEKEEEEEEEEENGLSLLLFLLLCEMRESNKERFFVAIATVNK